MGVPRNIGVATTMRGVFLYHREDPDLSGGVAISGVICHDMWGLLRFFVPINDV
jgi:hypothetical protein